MLSIKRQHLLASFRKISRIASYLHIDGSRKDLAGPLSLQSLQPRNCLVSPPFIGGGITQQNLQFSGLQQ